MTRLLFCLALFLLPSCAVGGQGVDFQRVAFYQQEARALRDQATAIRAMIATDRAAGKTTEAIAMEIGLAVQQVVMETLMLPGSRPNAQQ